MAWLRFAQLRHHVEEERPRCLWPTEVSYHDYAVPWFLADNHCTTEADGPLEALQAVAPDLLKTPMLL